MNIARYIFKLCKSKNGIFTFVFIIAYAVIMSFLYTTQIDNDGNFKNLEKIAFITTQQTPEVTQLKQYLEKNYKIVEVENEDYAISTGYIEGSITLEANFKENMLENKKIGDLKGDDTLLKLRVNEFINAYQKNDFSILDKKLEIKKIQKAEVNNSNQLFNTLGYVIFIIGGLICISFIKPFIDEKILEKTKLSGYNMRKYLIQVLGSIFSIVAILILFVCIYYMIKLNISFIYMLGYFVNALLYAIVVLSIVLFIYILTKKEELVNILCSTVGVFISMLGGVFFPFESSNKILSLVVKLLPSYYFVQLNEKFNLLYVLIQFGYILIFVLATLNILKRRKEQ